MNKLRLKITDRAKEDIHEIIEYIAKDNKQAAKCMSQYFYKICTVLSEFPNLGIIRPDFTYKDFHFYIVKKRYIIAYYLDENNIYIARVLSGYQDICALL